jgi:hypothetical protein
VFTLKKERHRIRQFSQVLEDKMNRRKSLKEINQERLRKETWAFSSIDPYKTKTMVEDVLVYVHR